MKNAIEEKCANCGSTYAEHGEETSCKGKPNGFKWFPKHIADALTRQQRRIRRAQKELGKTYAARSEEKERR